MNFSTLALTLKARKLGAVTARSEESRERETLEPSEPPEGAGAAIWELGGSPTTICLCINPSSTQVESKSTTSISPHCKAMPTQANATHGCWAMLPAWKKHMSCVLAKPQLHTVQTKRIKKGWGWSLLQKQLSKGKLIANAHLLYFCPLSSDHERQPTRSIPDLISRNSYAFWPLPMSGNSPVWQVLQSKVKTLDLPHWHATSLPHRNCISKYVFDLVPFHVAHQLGSYTIWYTKPASMVKPSPFANHNGLAGPKTFSLTKCLMPYLVQNLWKLDKRPKHDLMTLVENKVSSKQAQGSPHQLDVLAVGQRCVSDQPSNIGCLRSSGCHGIRFEEWICFVGHLDAVTLLTTLDGCWSVKTMSCQLQIQNAFLLHRNNELIDAHWGCVGRTLAALLLQHNLSWGFCFHLAEVPHFTCHLEKKWAKTIWETLSSPDATRNSTALSWFAGLLKNSCA